MQLKYRPVIMLRSSLLSLPSSICKRYNLVTATSRGWHNLNSWRSYVTTSFPIQQHQRLHFRSSLSLLSTRSGVCCNLQDQFSSLRTLRLLSTSGSNTNNKSDQATNTSTDGDGKQQSSDSNEVVLTPGETVVAVSRLSMWAGIAVFAAACAYYIVLELVPT